MKVCWRIERPGRSGRQWSASRGRRVGGVHAAAGSHHIEVRAGVRVLGPTASGGGAHRDHARRTGRVGHGGVGLVSGGGHHRHSLGPRVAERREHVGDLTRAHARGELEAQVDHVHASPGRVPDPAGDGHRVPRPLRVQHPEGHDPRAIGDARGAEPVVGGLGDGAGHVGAVAEHVVWVAVATDEVVALEEGAAAEVGSPAVAAPVLVGHAAVKHRHGGAPSSGSPAIDRDLPRLGHGEAEGADQVPSGGSGEGRRG